MAEDPGKTIKAEQRARAEVARTGSLAGALGEMPLWKQVVTLAMWPFFEQILSFLVSSVDLFLAARMSEGAERVAILDALGLGGYVAWLMMIVQSAVAGGVLAIISRAAGQRKTPEARVGLVQGILAGFLVGFLSGLLIRLCLPALTNAFSLSAEARGFADDYLSVLVWSCPLLGVFYSCTYAMRAVGDTRTPFLVMVLVNVSNVLWSWYFVFGGPDLGVKGLALGSVVAWLIATVLVLVVLWKERAAAEDGAVTLSLRGERWRPDREMIRRIVRVGLPQGLEMGGMWLIHAVTIGFITRLAVDGALGAHFIAIRVESLSFLPGFAIGTAGATLVGQYLGAGNAEAAARAVRAATGFAVAFMSVIGAAFLWAPAFFVEVILPADDVEARGVSALAVPLVFLCGMFQPVLAATLVLKTTLRGAGATRIVMVYSFLSMVIFRALMVPLGVTHFNFGLREIWLVMMIDVTVQAICFSIVFARGRWKTVKV